MKPKHMELIRRKAQQHAADSLTIDDLVSEGYFVYLRAQETYNPKMAKFSTYLYRKLSARFQYLQWKERGIIISDKVEQVVNRHDSEDRNIFTIMMGELSDSAQLVCNTILEAPADFIDIIVEDKNKITIKGLIKYLRSKGWKYVMIDHAFDEIKKFLETY